jgi:TetR/AcrR family transcriptional repressor of nem operon
MTVRATRKGETHQRILKSAAALARRQGLAAASVPKVMSGAGLTVGGFYAHFDSKTAMDAELIRMMLGTTLGRWFDGLDNVSGIAWLTQVVERYLSATHRDNVDGCGYPSVISEVARAGPDVRAAFTEAVEFRVQALAAHAPALTGTTPRERALATLALSVGGLLLARATRGDAVSDDMLSACRKWALAEGDAGRAPASPASTTASARKPRR